MAWVAALLVLVVAQHAAATEIAIDIPSLRRNAPEVPVFPPSYELEYVFKLPYVDVVQSQGLRYPVHVWFDGAQQAFRQQVFGGLDTQIITKDFALSLYPRIDETVCDISRSSGPTSNGLNGLTPPLPNLKDWKYSGTTRVGDKKANVWTFTHRNDDKVNSYSFVVSPDGTPLKLHMMGYNILAMSHFDEYLIDFLSFKAGPIPPENFAPPACCDAAKTPQQAAESQHHILTAQMKLLLPLRGLGESVFHPVPQDSAPTSARLANTLGNHELIRSWNAVAEKRFSLRMNKYGHLLPAEYSTLLTGHRPMPHLRPRKVGGRYMGVYTRTLPDSELPTEVDWRGTGADWMVKDQATCGSCWAFATTGALQGAWYVATGEILSLSEQQLVDCSWEYGNMGCGGGNMEPAIQYLADALGSYQEEDYPYLGQNAFCRANKTGAAMFAGYQNVAPRDEKALMEAVYLYGPVSVSIDASLPTFRFYSEGVYEDARCKVGVDELDHAVLVVGYGTSKDGEDYWLIRNSWSQYWGEDGYIRMSRKHDCGITSDPVMAVVAQKFVVGGASAALRAKATTVSVS